MPEESPSASINRELAAKISAAYVRWNQIGSDPHLDRARGARRSRKTGSRSQRCANSRGADPPLRSTGPRGLPRMWVARSEPQAACRDRPWLERGAVSCKVEPTTGSPDHGPRLFRASLHDGETAWSGSNSRGLDRNDGGARNGNPDGPRKPRHRVGNRGDH
jgi:hypothetical protein